MNNKLLTKGLEIELFAGSTDGNVVPISNALSNELKWVTFEPDQRYFEYITKPSSNYKELFKDVILPRKKIRETLKDKWALTLIPGSTIPLEFKKDLVLAKEHDPYYEYIKTKYGANIITISMHINFGIEGVKDYFKLLSALRLDTSLFLALSASSPFFDGKVTNYNSYRWQCFPKTPKFVPFFLSHEDYINWSNEMIEKKEIYNARNLWTSIRPNGPERPHKINRIEIRICDFVYDINKALSIVALIECIIQSYIENNNWPSVLNQSKSKLDDLSIFLDSQEETVAQNGLDAEVYNWRTDSKQTAREIIESIYKNSLPISTRLGITNYLCPILSILEEGNEATQFLKHYGKSKSISNTIQYFLQEFHNTDLKAYDTIKDEVKINL